MSLVLLGQVGRTRAQIYAPGERLFAGHVHEVSAGGVVPAGGVEGRRAGNGQQERPDGASRALALPGLAWGLHGVSTLATLMPPAKGAKAASSRTCAQLPPLENLTPPDPQGACRSGWAMRRP